MRPLPSISKLAVLGFGRQYTAIIGELETILCGRQLGIHAEFLFGFATHFRKLISKVVGSAEKGGPRGLKLGGRYGLTGTAKSRVLRASISEPAPAHIAPLA